MTARKEIISSSKPIHNHADLVLNSIADAILTIDGADNIIYANVAAEQLLGSSLRILQRKKLEDLISHDSPIMALVSKARGNKAIVTEYDVNIGNPSLGVVKVDAHVSLLQGDPENKTHEELLIQFQSRTVAQKINQQLSHRNATRSVSSMAAMLAHEIKNPLSGIKGSAQILSHDVDENDKALTDLIIEEVDRICSIVDRMEIFTDHRQIARTEINIHSVLEHVKMLAENGFGGHVNFVELYDPSLPETVGDRGGLIQVFLNLLKNACEATPHHDAQINITTAYRQGFRVSALGSNEMLHLPLEICIIDNGTGIADDIKDDIFDPFVTTKTSGTGLGLALVAKTINDHGGVIECESGAGKTTFRILLPAAVKRLQEETNV